MNRTGSNDLRTLAHSDLSTLIENIYNEYTPLSELDRQLIQRNSDDQFKKLVNEKCLNLSEMEKQRVNNELFSWGPLQELLERDDLFEIIIQGSEKIYFEDSQGMKENCDSFLSPRSFNQFLNRLIKVSGILINQNEPFASGSFKNFRLHMVIPPIVEKPIITLRKKRTLTLNWQDLTVSNFMSPHQAELIDQMIADRANILIVGPTGSGKTTFLNSVIARVSPLERIVCIEDTDEISQDHPMVCKLLSREVCPDTLKVINLTELLKQSLRMRPDRIVVGEVRGGEAKDLLQALATGHSGSMGTLHAESAHQALLRLEMLIQMGAPQWSLHSIRQLIQMSLKYIVVLKANRLEKGIKEIYRIGSVESFGVLLEEIKGLKTIKAV